MDLLPFEKALAGKKILITGHSGFTGSWACLWLQAIGAEIAGYSLASTTTPSLFEALELKNTVASTFADIYDYEKLYNTVEAFQPELVLHLAAQPLVRQSYQDPVRTFAVNTQGTAHILEAARKVKSVRGVLCITTDKVYKNNEWAWPYRENDPLGGKDPYSASKAAAEMIIQSFACSYPFEESKGPAIATARGGNIIGGGDWSEDRLIPDFVRALINRTSLTLRFPNATRPWQHVLALVHGYLILMAGLISNNPKHYAKAWNLGPSDTQQFTVRNLLELMSACWEPPEINHCENPLPEAGFLALDSSQARNYLGWYPVWNTKKVIEQTITWYRDYYHNPSHAKELTLAQIENWRQGIKILQM